MRLRELVERIRRWRPKKTARLDGRANRPVKNKRPKNQAAVHGYPFLDDEELRQSIYGGEED